jgi:hypothetical protein
MFGLRLHNWRQYTYNKKNQFHHNPCLKARNPEAGRTMLQAHTSVAITALGVPYYPPAPDHRRCRPPSSPSPSWSISDPISAAGQQQQRADGNDGVKLQITFRNDYCFTPVFFQNDHYCFKPVFQTDFQAQGRKNKINWCKLPGS